MFLKSISKYCKSEKTRVAYYRLCESYRDEHGFPRQRMIIGLGRLEELPTVDQKVLFNDRINQLIKGQPSLYGPCPDPCVERLAQYYYKQIRLKGKVDKTPNAQDDIETVKINTLENKEIYNIGAESICYQAFEQLRINEFLASRNWGPEQIELAATHIISRAVYPASELKTVSWIKENSAVCQLTGYEKEKITKDKLYGISHKLYREKQGLENHLSRCTNDLFNLHDKVILYDLTNTYFEGSMRGSSIAKFGRSKEKRNDAKIIVLAVIVNTEGFLKYSDIFEGNTADCNTLRTVINKLNQQAGYNNKKPVIVMDAGIATDDNIHFLKEEGYPYLCVSRSNLKNYTADTESKPVRIVDKKNGHPIELLKVKVENDGDNYLWIRSHAKAEKENAMHHQFADRFEQGLRAVQNGILKKGGTKTLTKVWERIGRLKEKYSSVHHYYEIKVTGDKTGKATGLIFEKKATAPNNKRAGIYFLRTSLRWADEKNIWTIYNAIREIEYTFRVLKTDLDLRPIYHKTDDASMAHLHLGLLAYWLVSTIRYQLKIKGYKHDWREIVRTMNTQKVVTTTVEKENGDIIKIKQCSTPSEDAKNIYNLLKYNPTPIKRKKSVWHTGENFKSTEAHYQKVNDS